MDGLFHTDRYSEIFEGSWLSLTKFKYILLLKSNLNILKYIVQSNEIILNVYKCIRRE